MWVWWAISMIIVVGIIIFAIYIFITNRSLHPFIPKFEKPRKKIIQYLPRISNHPEPDELATYLKVKMQSLEENFMLYTSKLNKFNERLQYLENANATEKYNNGSRSKDAENWEELYYEILDKSQKLENELDSVTQDLEAKESIIINLENELTSNSEKKSFLDSELDEAHSLQNKIELLQREKQAAAEREDELERLLIAEITVREEFEFLQHKYAHLQSEADELRGRIVETNKSDVALRQKMHKISELESNLEIAVTEIKVLRKRLEEMIDENEKLSATIIQINSKSSSKDL